MNNTKDAIVERIKKLFALSADGSGATEGEALAAAARAQELIAKYELTMSDIESGKQQSDRAHREFAEETTYSSTQYDHFEVRLANATALIANVEVLHVSNRYERKKFNIHFLGERVDVMLATAIFNELRNSAARIARRCYGGGWTKEHRSFSIGFADEVGRRAVLLKREGSGLAIDEQNRYAIVLADKKTWIEREVKLAHPNLVTKVAPKVRGGVYYDSYAHGRSEGGKASLDFKKSIA